MVLLPPLEDELLDEELELDELLLDEELELDELLLDELELLLDEELDPPSPLTVTLAAEAFPGEAVKPNEVDPPGAICPFQSTGPITKCPPLLDCTWPFQILVMETAMSNSAVQFDNVAAPSLVIVTSAWKPETQSLTMVMEPWAAYIADHVRHRNIPIKLLKLRLMLIMINPSRDVSLIRLRFPNKYPQLKSCLRFAHPAPSTTRVARASPLAHPEPRTPALPEPQFQLRQPAWLTYSVFIVDGTALPRFQ
jgi:hypothetical protein